LRPELSQFKISLANLATGAAVHVRGPAIAPAADRPPFGSGG